MEYRRAVLDTKDPSAYYLKMLYNNHPNCALYLVYIEEMEKVYRCLTFNNVPYTREVTQLVENMYIISQNNRLELFLQPFPSKAGLLTRPPLVLTGPPGKDRKN